MPVQPLNVQATRIGRVEAGTRAAERRISGNAQGRAAGERRLKARRSQAVRTGAGARAATGTGGSTLRTLGRAAGRVASAAGRFAGPIAAAGLAGRELIDRYYQNQVKRIEGGSQINSPEVEKNRTISTAVQQQKFKYDQPTQRKLKKRRIL